MGNLSNKAKEIAKDMYIKGLSPWHASQEVINRGLPITKFEQEKLSKMVATELYKLQS